MKNPEGYVWIGKPRSSKEIMKELLAKSIRLQEIKDKTRRQREACVWDDSEDDIITTGCEVVYYKTIMIELCMSAPEQDIFFCPQCGGRIRYKE